MESNVKKRNVNVNEEEKDLSKISKLEKKIDKLEKENKKINELLRPLSIAVAFLCMFKKEELDKK